MFNNIRKSFPEKSEKEVMEIGDQFFRYFCDFIMEVIKNISISPKSVLKRCTISSDTIELFKGLAAKKQSAIIVMGHKGNWELAGNSFSLLLEHDLHVVYHPLKNKYFDRLIYNTRTRFGTQLIDMRKSYERMRGIQDSLHCVALIADQSPKPQNAFWLEFLNQDTGVYLGPERYARETGYPIIFLDVYLKKRGYYELRSDYIETTSLTEFGEITQAHVSKLENAIHEQPHTWMWSHKRWKHKRPPITEMSWYNELYQKENH